MAEISISCVGAFNYFLYCGQSVLLSLVIVWTDPANRNGDLITVLKR